jgi:predicted secreted hydrolase
MKIRDLIPVLLLGGVAAYIACSDENSTFRFATPDRGINLPADHAAHPDFQNEWWYYTGQLKARDGRRYGFQLTWFRVGLTKEQQEGSRFRSPALYFAHFSITDKEKGTFRYAEKIARGGHYDDAGADDRVFRTWIEDWKVEGLGSMFYLTGRTDSMALSLIATPAKPPVLEGNNGYSQKGDDPKNASMYYSYPRLGVVGVLTLDGEPVEVEGTAWMDHEFGTTMLGKNQIGWDWFSIQLANNEELMLYGIRRPDGSYDPHAVGAYIQANGARVPLAPDQYTIQVLDHWTSSASKAVYPSKWRITVPSQNLDLTVTPYVQDQELRTESSTRVTYWEGAVRAQGTRGGAQIAGEGYVELTGYAGKPAL